MVFFQSYSPYSTVTVTATVQMHRPGNKRMEVTQKTVTVEDTHLKWLIQTVEAAYYLLLNFRMHMNTEQGL